MCICILCGFMMKFINRISMGCFRFQAFNSAQNSPLACDVVYICGSFFTPVVESLVLIFCLVINFVHIL